MDTIAFIAGPLAGVIFGPLMLITIVAATIRRSKKPAWVGLGLCSVFGVACWSYWWAFRVSWSQLDAGRATPARIEFVEVSSLYGSALAVLGLVVLGTFTLVRRLAEPTSAASGGR